MQHIRHRIGRKDRLRTVIYGDFCVYCGVIARTLDHFPPRRITNLGWLLPSCIQCNLAAGDYFGFDFKMRCARVRYSILRRGEEQGIDVKERLAWDIAAYLLSIDKNRSFIEWVVKQG